MIVCVIVSVCVCVCVCVSVKGNSAETQIPTYCNVIGHSKAATPPVIAQQYSSATFVSWCFYNRKEKFSLISEKLFLFSFKKIA